MTTQREIAQSLGVSCATVANILSGQPGLRYSQATRDKVVNAAAKMGYQQNRASKVLRTGRSNLIGIVHFGADVEAARRSNAAISEYAIEAGFNYLAVDMNCHGGSVDRTINELVQARVEGVIISHIQDVFTEAHINTLRRARIPVVAINGEPKAEVHLICDNVEKAFFGLTEHLIEQGHRCLLQLGPRRLIEHPTDKQPRNIQSHRVSGFKQAVEKAGRFALVREEEFFPLWPKIGREHPACNGIFITQDSRLYDTVAHPVHRFCQQLFATGEIPDAIVCPNDMYAMEVIAAAREYGISIPGDLALTGYDDDRMSRLPGYGITTARQDIEGICEAAVSALVDSINAKRAGKSVKSFSRYFDSEIIVRTSSARSGSFIKPTRTSFERATCLSKNS